MIVYISAFLISLIFYCAIAGNRRTGLVDGYSLYPKKRRCSFTKFELAVFCASLPPMFISAVRYYVGTDYLTTYYSGFYRILEGSVVDGFEVGYYYLNRLIQLFTTNAFWLFSITSVLIVGITYKAIADISVDVPLSIILFLVTRYYFIGMNGIRQFIGLAIFAYSLKYIFERDITKFGLCVFAACMFHYSCVLFVPVYFAAKLKLSKTRIIILILASLTVFSIGVPLILRAMAGTKYGLLAMKYDTAGIKFTIFTIVLNAALFFIGYVNYKKCNNDLKYCTCLNLQFIALLTSFGLRSIPLMERVYWIYSFPVIITFPYLLYCFRGSGIRNIVKWGVILVFSIYMFYDICILEDHEVLPYQWILGKKAIPFSGWEWYGGHFQ